MHSSWTLATGLAHWSRLLFLVVVLAHGEPAEAGARGLRPAPANNSVFVPAAPKRIARLHRRSSNAFGSQYFHANSAIPLDRGAGSYRNTLVSWNTVAYGLTPHLSVGGGVDLYSTFNARRVTPVWMTRMQVGGEVGNNLHLAGTAFYLRLPLLANAESPDTAAATGTGAVMAILTWGNSNDQFTLSGGWSHDGMTTARGPLLNAAGAFRIFPNVQVITEHWLLLDPDRDLMANSLGVRIIGDHLAIDLGVVHNRELAGKVFSWGMPFLAATLNF